MPNFTTDDLLKYLYSDTSIEQKKELEKELESNWALKEKLEVLKESKRRLDRFKLFSPRHQSIEAILKYAQNSTKQTEQIN